MQVQMSGAAKQDAEEPLRLGVIGVGIMGSNHARVLADLSGVKVVGIADPGASHRALLGQVIGCAVCDDADALLDMGIDAAVIAAPTHLHHDIALTCIKRGVHVLVEKPIASNVAEGRAIVAAAERAGVTLMVGHVERFNPAVQVIKEAIRGEDILSIAITRVGPFPPRMSNVGVVIDLAVHDIDLIRWFTDSEITEVQPQIKSAIAEREDIALLQFRTASGVLAQINTNWLTRSRRAPCTSRRARNTSSAICSPPGDRVLRLPARRQLFDAPPLGRTRRAAALRAVRVRDGDPRRSSRRRTGAEGVASLEVAMRCLQGDVTPRSASRAACGLTRCPFADQATTDRMNQHTRLDARSRSSTSRRSAAASARASTMPSRAW
jgi:predicted dehydrogenase